MAKPKLTPELIAAAIQGYEAQKARIDQRIAQLRAMLPGGRTESSAPRKRGRRSAAARARIAEAQRKPWAAAKKEATRSDAPKPKRRLSAAGRRRIIEATKKRWAAVRAAKAEQVKS